MKLGPRYKIAKRLGSPIFEKTQTQRFAVSQQRSAANKKGKRKGPGSDYSRQLIEKQKLRLTYGLTEKQFSSYVKKALESESNPQSTLFILLETRLDSIVYRMKLAGTRRMARQMVSHGHFIVDGSRTKVPSHHISVGQVITVREGSKDGALFAGLTDRLKEAKLSSWISFDAEKKEGSLLAEPVFSEQDTPADIGAVFEYYTR